MKQLVDYIPVLAFVGVYVCTDIYVATGALMVSAVVLLVVFRLKKWPISRQLWVIVWGALIFGGLTLVLQDKTFIQWKPTVFYWFVACAIVGSRYVGRGDYIQKALGKVLVLSDRAKTHLAWGWGVALLVAGGANLLVAYEFSEPAWVTYKLISAFAVPILLTVASVAYLAVTGQLPDEEALDRAESQ